MRCEVFRGKVSASLRRLEEYCGTAQSGRIYWPLSTGGSSKIGEFFWGGYLVCLSLPQKDSTMSYEQLSQVCGREGGIKKWGEFISKPKLQRLCSETVGAEKKTRWEFGRGRKNQHFYGNRQWAEIKRALFPCCVSFLPHSSPHKRPWKGIFLLLYSFPPQFLIIPRLLFRLVSGKSRLAIKAAEFFKVPLFFSVSFGASIWEMEPKRRKRCAITPLSPFPPFLSPIFFFYNFFFAKSLSDFLTLRGWRRRRRRRGKRKRKKGGLLTKMNGGNRRE